MACSGPADEGLSPTDHDENGDACDEVVARRLIEPCLGAGRPFFVLAFDGETEAATVAGEAR